MLDRQEELSEQLKIEQDKLSAKVVELTPADVKSDVMSIDSNIVGNGQAEDPFLAEAMKMGFDPNHEGPNKKTAEQFVKDGSFFKKINDQKKELEDVKKIVREMSEHARKVEKASYEKALFDLQAAKRKAASEADLDAYDRFEAEQNKVKEKIQEVNKTPDALPPEIPSEIKEFARRNEAWFNKDTPENELMAKTADGLFAVVAERARLKGESITMEEQLKRVENEIKNMPMFKHKFENEAQERPSMVAKSTVSTGSKTKSLAGRLTEQQRKFVKTAAMYGSKLSEEDYAKQLQITGDLRDE